MLILRAAGPEPALIGALHRLVGVKLHPATTLAASALVPPPTHRAVTLLRNTPEHAGLLARLLRFGGAAVLGDGCLLAAYAGHDPAVQALAAAELGRPVSMDEIRRWRAGEVRPAATLLGAVAAAAEPIITHSAPLAAKFRERCGRATVIVPRPIGAASHPGTPDRLQLLAAAEGLAAEACVWALDILRSWSKPAVLHLMAPPGPALLARCRELGLTDLVTFGPPAPPARVFLSLSVRGTASLCSATARALARGVPSVVSEWIADSLDLPDWAHLVPDEPSPPLIAEAVLAALDLPPSPSAIHNFQRRHDPARCARLLCAALGIDR